VKNSKERSKTKLKGSTASGRKKKGEINGHDGISGHLCRASKLCKKRKNILRGTGLFGAKGLVKQGKGTWVGK